MIDDDDESRKNGSKFDNKIRFYEPIKTSIIVNSMTGVIKVKFSRDVRILIEQDNESGIDQGGRRLLNQFYSQEEEQQLSKLI